MSHVTKTLQTKRLFAFTVIPIKRRPQEQHIASSPVRKFISKSEREREMQRCTRKKKG